MPTHRETLLALLEGGRVLRYRDLASVDGRPIPRMELLRLHRAGIVEPIESAEGLGYRLAGVATTPLQRLAAVHPGAVLCGIYAQRQHEADDTVAMAQQGVVAAIPRARHRQPVEGVTLVSWSNPSLFQVGIETIDVGGSRLRRTDRVRTVLDMYRPSRGALAGDVDAEAREKALAKLLEGRGAAAAENLKRFSEYAMQLGLWKSLERHVGMLKGLLSAQGDTAAAERDGEAPCATMTRRS